MLALVAFLACAIAHATVAVGDAVPDGLGVDREGNRPTTPSLRGKVVVMTFWASWCGWCLKELPVLENLQRHAGKDRLEVFAINVDRHHGDYVAIRRRLKDFTLNLTRDDDRSLSAAYGVSGLPHMVLDDTTGHVAYLHIGYPEKSLTGFVREINTLMDSDAVDTPQG
jgi:thiol-disulfide isomerase/thioredoxin